MPPDLDRTEALTRALRRIAARVRVAACLRMGTVVVAASAILIGLLGVLGVPLLTTGIGTFVISAVAWFTALHSRRQAWTLDAAAALFERAHPQSRNVVVTAQELIDHPARAQPWIRSRVVDDAAAMVRDVDAATVVPLRRATISVLAAAVIPAVVIVVMPQSLATLRRAAGPGVRRSESGFSVATSTTATISAPAYTGIAQRTLENPQRIDAVEGSQLHVDVHGDPDGYRIRFGSAASAGAGRDGSGTIDLRLTESGYLAVESVRSKTLAFLIPVSVTPDRVPTVRVEAPGKDLLMPNASAAIGVSTSATDDFGLQSLDLRYTKVSGSGEQFEFVEGSLPLDIARESDQSWKGKAAIALGSLGLQPGDTLVYHVVARDRRPGDGGSASSDTFFVEVAGPGQVAVEGFELPPDRERYALSQQMIVLKIQRLRAREASMARKAVQQETAALSAEQRAVRANFVFLMGGQVEDEEQEAEQSHEIQEGRLENSARREINSAIQFMSHAEQALAAVDSARALPPAKSAVEALQRAFGHNRYFLRTLPVRSRVDPSRRLSGDLKDASGWRRDLESAEVDRRTRAARRILSGLLAARRTVEEGATISPAVIDALAEEALAVDPASPEWQNIARRLMEVRDGLALGKTAAPDALWQSAVAALAVAAEKSGVKGPIGVPSALRGAWADEGRRP